MSDAYSKAKEFFEREYGNDWIRVHSACVIDCCNGMIRGTDLDSVVFDIAGWIHDIGRKDDKDRHHEIGLEYLGKFLHEHPEFDSIRAEASDCILNHRTGREPETIYGKIMQLADKVAAHHEDWVKFVAGNS